MDKAKLIPPPTVFTPHQAKAWQVLTQEEREALVLEKGHGKTTWQAGEILRKVHYKYLEIKERAINFLQKFSTYYGTYPELFPEEVEVDPDLRSFIEHLVISRLKPREAALQSGCRSFIVKDIRNKHLAAFLESLRLGETLHHANLLNILIEFDKWNNYRILPPEYQEPHAFKRRNTKRHKKHISDMCKLNALAHDILKTRYAINGPSELGYTILLKGYDNYSYELMSCVNTQECLSELTKYTLFVFKDIRDATALANLMSGYMRDGHTLLAGHKFWPVYRSMAEKAINYTTVENLMPSRNSIKIK